MEIETIQEENQNLGLKLQISLQWKDARVQFYNLKLDEHENSLTPDEKKNTLDMAKYQNCHLGIFGSY